MLYIDLSREHTASEYRLPACPPSPRATTTPVTVTVRHVSQDTVEKRISNINTARVPEDQPSLPLLSLHLLEDSVECCAFLRLSPYM